MSFNSKNMREWNKWVKHSRHILNECGIPDYIYKSKKRWYIFLEHKYDEVGWFNDHHSAWSIDNLSKDGAKKFHDFIAREYPNEYLDLLKSLESIFN